ncbi:MAG: MarR family winged helix-turn-helix transcriptional regulator, partial [Endomicrobiia bacterium]
MNEKEFAIIKEISNNYFVDQRKIAHNTGFSLGLTNLLIKKLVKKGFIKVKQLNGRKISYILTAKGFKEKLKKSYNYTLKTINVIKSIKEEVAELIRTEYNLGNKNFLILGKNEVADIVEITLNSLKLNGLKYYKILNEYGSKDEKAIVLDCNYDYQIDNIDNKSKNYINIISYLIQRGKMFG